MDKLKTYSISIINLKNQEYQYHYTIGKGFFEQFAYGLVEDGNLDIDLTLIKSETMIQLYFSIRGKVLLVCDRSLEEFYHPIETDETLLLKFGEVEAQLSDELEVISKNTIEINVAQYIYEFISIAIPMKKLHPRFIQEGDSQSLEEDELVYTSESDTPAEEEKEADVDPRWQILKKFKK